MWLRVWPTLEGWGLYEATGPGVLAGAQNGHGGPAFLHTSGPLIDFWEGTHGESDGSMFSTSAI